MKAIVVGAGDVGFHLADRLSQQGEEICVIDIDQETARLTKEIDKVAREIKKFDAKLSNEKFLAKAPEEVVEEQRSRKAEAEEVKGKLCEALERLQGAA